MTKSHYYKQITPVYPGLRLEGILYVIFIKKKSFVIFLSSFQFI